MVDWRSQLKLDELEAAQGLPAGLLSRVLQAESAGNPNAVSPAGAQGLFQFMPATARDFGIDPLDPQQAAQGAAKYLGGLARQYDGDVNMALAAYNWGPGNLDRNGIDKAPKETRDYIAKINGRQYADAGTTMTDAQTDGTFEVELPDGTVLEGIPVGTTREQIAQRLQSKGYDVSKLGESSPSPQQRTPLKAPPQFTSNSPVESAIQGLGNGISLGYLDEGIAGVAAPVAAGLDTAKGLINQIAGTNLETNNRSIGDTYRGIRDDIRSKQAQAQSDNPNAYLAGDVGGGILSGLILPLGNVARLPAALKAGAKLGAVAGLGNSEASAVDNPLAAAADILSGAAGGAAGGALGYGAGKVVSRVASNPAVQNLINDESGAVGRRAVPEGAAPKFNSAERAVVRSLIEEKGFSADEAADIIRNAGKAGEGGIPLTLPEASESKTLLSYERRLRENPGLASEVEGKFLRDRTTTGLPEAYQQQIRSNIGTITTPEAAGKRVISAAEDVIKRAEQKRSEIADPFYKLAYKQQIEPEQAEILLKDPIVRSAYEDMASSPIWQSRLAEYPPDSLGAFDVTKKYLDNQIQTLQSKGAREEAAIVTKAKNDFLDRIDDISPTYKEARGVYKAGSPRIERLQNSVVGVIADMEKNPSQAAQKLFNAPPAQIAFARRVIGSADPKGFNNLIATHLSNEGERLNHSPAKILNALSSKGDNGSILRDKALNAALTPEQQAVKDRIFSDLRRANSIRANSLTEANKKAGELMDAELTGTIENIGNAIKKGPTSLAELKNSAVDWTILKLKARQYKDLANIFTGNGAADFAERIAKVKPGTFESWKLINDRIAKAGGTAPPNLSEMLSQENAEQRKLGLNPKPLQVTIRPEDGLPPVNLP